MQVSFDPEQGDDGLSDDQLAVMQAVAELPQLQDLTVSDSVCGYHIQCLSEAAEHVSSSSWEVGVWRVVVHRLITRRQSDIDGS